MIRLLQYQVHKHFLKKKKNCRIYRIFSFLVSTNTLGDFTVFDLAATESRAPNATWKDIKAVFGEHHWAETFDSHIYGRLFQYSDWEDQRIRNTSSSPPTLILLAGLVLPSFLNYFPCGHLLYSYSGISSIMQAHNVKWDYRTLITDEIFFRGFLFKTIIDANTHTQKAGSSLCERLAWRKDYLHEISNGKLSIIPDKRLGKTKVTSSGSSKLLTPVPRI